MVDRQPTKPGRIKLTADPSAAGYYYMERADEPNAVGTPINKATLFNSNNETRFDCDLPSEALELLTKEWTVSVATSSWSSAANSAGWYTATISVSGMKSVYNPLATLVVSSATLVDDEQAAWGLVKEIITADGSITLRATDKPDVALKIKLSGV